MAVYCTAMLKAYPTLTTGELFVFAPGKIFLYNAAGQLISTLINGRNDIGYLPSGRYIIKSPGLKPVSIIKH